MPRHYPYVPDMPDELKARLGQTAPTAPKPPAATLMDAVNKQKAQQAPSVQPVPVPATSTQQGPVGITPRETSPAVQQLLDLLKSKIGSAPLTGQDIMNDPEFQSQKGAIDFQRQQAQAQLNRSLASRNMLRSTPAVQALAGSDAEYTAREQALVPQMLATAYQRKQQELANIANLLTQTEGIENTRFNQGLAEFNATSPFNLQTQAQMIQQEQFNRDFGIREAGLTGMYQGSQTFPASVTEAGLTGQYLPSQAQQLIQALISAKKRATAEAQAGNVAESDRISRELGNPLRAQLAAYGIDAEALFGANVSPEQALANAARASTLTMQGRANEAALTGIDPRTGLPTYATQQDAQARLDALAAAAVANEKNIANATAAETAAREKEIAALRSQAEKDIKADYDVGNTAANVWGNLVELANTQMKNGQIPTRIQMIEAKEALMRQGGLLTKEQAILTLMLEAYLGNQTAQQNLSRLRKNAEESSEEKAQRLLR